VESIYFGICYNNWVDNHDETGFQLSGDKGSIQMAGRVATFAETARTLAYSRVIGALLRVNHPIQCHDIGERICCLLKGQQ
jgi:hypothetical protein